MVEENNHNILSSIDATFWEHFCKKSIDSVHLGIIKTVSLKYQINLLSGLGVKVQRKKCKLTTYITNFTTNSLGVLLTSNLRCKVKLFNNENC